MFPLVRSVFPLVPSLSEHEALVFLAAFTVIRKELSVSSRNLISEDFSESSAFNLPLGHATVSFSEIHVGAIVCAVSDCQLQDDGRHLIESGQT